MMVLWCWDPFVVWSNVRQWYLFVWARWTNSSRTMLWWCKFCNWLVNLANSVIAKSGVKIVKLAQNVCDTAIWIWRVNVTFKKFWRWVWILRLAYVVCLLLIAVVVWMECWYEALITQHDDLEFLMNMIVLEIFD